MCFCVVGEDGNTEGRRLQHHPEELCGQGGGEDQDPLQVLLQAASPNQPFIYVQVA